MGLWLDLLRWELIVSGFRTRRNGRLPSGGSGVCGDTCSDASDRLARVLLDADVEAPFVDLTSPGFAGGLQKSECVLKAFFDAPGSLWPANTAKGLQ